MGKKDLTKLIVVKDYGGGHVERHVELCILEGGYEEMGLILLKFVLMQKILLLENLVYL